MFKDLLTSQEEIQKSQNSISKQSSMTNSELCFHTILCPKTAQPISSNKCKSCSSKKEFTRYHETGSTMNTIICLWNNDDED